MLRSTLIFEVLTECGSNCEVDDRVEVSQLIIVHTSDVVLDRLFGFLSVLRIISAQTPHEIEQLILLYGLNPLIFIIIVVMNLGLLFDFLYMILLYFNQLIDSFIEILESRNNYKGSE
jgi:hypothetical protein